MKPGEGAYPQCCSFTGSPCRVDTLSLTSKSSIHAASSETSFSGHSVPHRPAPSSLSWEAVCLHASTGLSDARRAPRATSGEKCGGKSGTTESSTGSRAGARFARRLESVARPATTVMRHGPALLPSVIQRAPAGRPGSGTWRIQRWIEPTSRFRRHTVHHCAPAAGSDH